MDKQDNIENTHAVDCNFDVRARVIEIKSRHSHKNAFVNDYLAELSDFFMSHLESSLNKTYEGIRHKKATEVVCILQQSGDQLLLVYKQHMVIDGVDQFFKSDSMDGYLSQHDQCMINKLAVICDLLKQKHLLLQQKKSQIVIMCLSFVSIIMIAIGIEFMFDVR